MFDMQKRRPIEQASFDVDFAVLLAGLNTVSTGEGTSEAKFEHFWTGVISTVSSVQSASRSRTTECSDGVSSRFVAAIVLLHLGDRLEPLLKRLDPQSFSRFSQHARHHRVG